MTRSTQHPTILRGYCLRVSCPACGPFGRRARRRARELGTAALVAFWDRLAREHRAGRESTWQAIIDWMSEGGSVHYVLLDADTGEVIP